MKLLLDTHTFLWSVSSPSKLPGKARAAIEDTSNEAFVSAVSLWEIAIKVRIGKLDLGSEADLIETAHDAGFELISLTPDEAATSSELLATSHQDPFDRMIIWQAIRRQFTLVSGDPEFASFKNAGLRLLWK